MRARISTAALVAGAVALAALPLAASAQEECLDTSAVLEKIQNPGITAGKLNEPQIVKLAAAFSEAHPGQKMATGNHALVFHREDAPLLDWMVLFQDGCAKFELPIDSVLVREVMDGTYVDPIGKFNSFKPDNSP